LEQSSGGSNPLFRTSRLGLGSRPTHDLTVTARVEGFRCALYGFFCRLCEDAGPRSSLLNDQLPPDRSLMTHARSRRRMSKRDREIMYGLLLLTGIVLLVAMVMLFYTAAS
jgi:hypothetical protein